MMADTRSTVMDEPFGDALCPVCKVCEDWCGEVLEQDRIDETLSNTTEEA